MPPSSQLDVSQFFSLSEWISSVWKISQGASYEKSPSVFGPVFPYYFLFAISLDWLDSLSQWHAAFGTGPRVVFDFFRPQHHHRS